MEKTDVLGGAKPAPRSTAVGGRSGVKGELVLGVDQGTGSTKAIVLDTSGQEFEQFSAPVPAPVQQGRRVTQQAEALVGSVQSILQEAFAWATSSGRRFRAIGLACQRSGVLAWTSETGIPVSPLLTWADTDTIKLIEKLGTTALKVSNLTGLPTIPNFAAGKLSELQAEFQRLGDRIATLDTYIAFILNGRQRFVTDDSMAARTMLYDLRNGKWSEELCKLFSVDIRKLPEIRSSIDDFGLIEGVPLKVMMGDQQAALLGRVTEEQLPLLNLGTIASLSIPTGDTPIFKPSLMSSVWFSKRSDRAKPGHDRAFMYLTELTSPITGPLLREIVDEKKFARDLRDLSSRCDESKRNARKIVAFNSFGRIYEPTWPHGVPDILIAGPDADDSDVARAHLENVGNHIVKLLDQFEEYQLCFQGKNREVMVAGGGSECRYLLQYIADCIDATLLVLPSREATARGAALATLVRDDQGRDVSSMNSLTDAVRIVPCDKETRQRYLKWRRLEQDVLAGRVPPIAKVSPREGVASATPRSPTN